VDVNHEQISGEVDALTQDIRQQLINALIEVPKATMVRRQTIPDVGHHQSVDALVCQQEKEADYYLTIDIVPVASMAQTQVRLRALDPYTNQWLPGFGLHWQGVLSKEQQRALSERSHDPYLRGLRSRPFQRDQSDMMAKYLAHNLSCLLQQRQMDQVKLYIPEPNQAPVEVLSAIRLVDNYLSRYREVVIVESKAQANALLHTEIVDIDPAQQLVLVNSRLIVKDTGLRLGGMDTQAYALVSAIPVHEPAKPAQQPAKPIIAEPQPAMEKTTFEKPDHQLGLTVVMPRRPELCRSLSPWQDGEWRLAHNPKMRHGQCFRLDIHSAAKWNWLIYQNPQGQWYHLDGACLGLTGQLPAEWSVPTLQNNPAVIDLLDGDVTESFYLLASDHQPTGPLRHFLQQLPSVCDGGVGASLPLDAKEGFPAWLANVADQQRLDWRMNVIAVE
jgi:hypothetical protein